MSAPKFTARGKKSKRRGRGKYVSIIIKYIIRGLCQCFARISLPNGPYASSTSWRDSMFIIPANIDDSSEDSLHIIEKLIVVFHGRFIDYYSFGLNGNKISMMKESIVGKILFLPTDS